jgi:cold shock CspA family protein
LKTWFLGRGFGFIKDDASSGPDIFMHISALLGSGIDPDELQKGDRLAYDIGPGRDGRPSASRISECSVHAAADIDAHDRNRSRSGR